MTLSSFSYFPPFWIRGMTLAVRDLACLAENGQIKSRYLNCQQGTFEARSLNRKTYTSRTCDPVPSLRKDRDLGTAILSYVLVVEMRVQADEKQYSKVG
jgi:hypothetical protein